ncbi:hypothetical protein GN157_13485 [Flavobacterium rakeshii]|uniref:Uncharacterized protein n=1 Tax=Flavobacterium rakeshii TaxID=1038845 RepID=A0A6N8HG91_9FLAO|nr:hypothetical protein [Flavobacterium rakeshii]MEE1897685.1 hypothetical protein [Flavobacterium rakeshii]MUV04723.1 hypothetical protein [Flavobacterium rakeshii]
MKKLFLLLVAGILTVACSGDSNTMVDAENKVLLLKVDLLTNTFEGGKELVFPDNENFTISTVYHPPGDFGDITLNYDEVNMPIFAGDIIWMGLGIISYPESMNAPEEFSSAQNAVEMPASSEFALVPYGDYPEHMYPEVIDYEGIWNAIENLSLVKQYRMINPQAKVNLFLYTPSVGIGDPADWDWIVILKN